uniref:Uncharacterized protein n=1 Tax=Ditylenchus dipsaci TaxID=166011 RepID=A0A915D3K1_9BILA
MCRKPISTQKEPRRKIIGTEADLRKLTLQEAKDLCRELGVQEEKLSVLSRWQIINVIRSISTQAAKTDKDDASLADAASKFARGNMKMNAHRIKIKSIVRKYLRLRISETENTKNSGDLDESKLDEDWEMEEIIVKTETGHDELDYQIAATSKPFQNSRVQVKQEHVDVENLLDLNGLRKTWNEAQKTHSNEIVNRQMIQMFDKIHFKSVCIKSEENDAIATESGIKELKIVRAIKDSAGNEHTEIESITDPTLIEAYLSIRATRDELFVKNYAQADMDYKSECRKAKRRLQDKVRRRRRNEMNAELGITRPKSRKKNQKACETHQREFAQNELQCLQGHWTYEDQQKLSIIYRQRHRPTRDYSEEGSSIVNWMTMRKRMAENLLKVFRRLSTKRARFSPTPSDSSYSRKSRNRSTGPENGADLLHYLKKEALDNYCNE